MEDFFKPQVIDVIQRAKARAKKTKVPRPPGAKKSPGVVTTLIERTLAKMTDDRCTACSLHRMKIGKKPAPPGYEVIDDYVYSKRFEEGKGNKQSDILIITEKWNKKSEMLITFLEKAYNLTLNDYFIIPGIWCLPIEGRPAKDSEAVAPYVACNILTIDKLIKEIKPKHIITIGRALFSITREKDPQRNKIKYRKLYSGKYKAHVYPVPELNFMLEEKRQPDGSAKYFFQDNWYRHLLKKHIDIIQNKTFPNFPEIQIKDTISQETEEIKKILREFLVSQIPFFVYDIESSGFVYMEDTIHGISLCEDQVTSYYLLWEKFDAEAKNLLNQLFLKKSAIAHNGKFDEKFLIWNGIENAKTDEDTMLAHHILHAELAHGLKPSAYMYTQYGGYDRDLDQYMKDNRLTKFSDVPIEILGPYSCMDVRVTYLIYIKFKRELARNKELKWLYTNISVPLARVFRKAEMKGMRIDQNYLDRYSFSKRIEVEKLAKECYQLAGRVFNLKSNKELPEVCKELKMPEVKKTAKGGFSTDQEAMDIWAKKGFPFAKAFQSYSRVNTQLNNFIGDYSKKGTEDKNGVYQHIRADGRVHNSFLVHGAETGRTASAGPNLQNQIKEKDYRRIYQCPEGFTFLEADFSQAELRLAAVLSDDKAMKEAFTLGRDIHCTTICSMTNRPYDEIKRLNDAKDPDVLKLRKKAKTVNFGVVYGETAFSLSEDLGISVDEAERFLIEYFKGFAGLGKWRNATQAFTATKAHTKTLWGRLRRFPELEHRTGISKSKMGGYMRQAMNTPVQGSASDYALFSMVQVDRMLVEGNYKTSIVAMVHDSIVMEAAKDELEELVPKIKHIMETCADIGVKMVADVDVSDIWGF